MAIDHVGIHSLVFESAKMAGDKARMRFVQHVVGCVYDNIPTNPQEHPARTHTYRIALIRYLRILSNFYRFWRHFDLLHDLQSITIYRH